MRNNASVHPLSNIYTALVRFLMLAGLAEILVQDLPSF